MAPNWGIFFLFGLPDIFEKAKDFLPRLRTNEDMRMLNRKTLNFRERADIEKAIVILKKLTNKKMFVSVHSNILIFINYNMIEYIIHKL